ncbi:hypothetical protein LTR97_011283 [Elasticomyces elasticus]|uniref:Uncharacterized protein n=1 Tax=Elasticomyces elasticus TaxID=574655 RepID=A0AAN7ZW38_9PEZI|nr:hypothetical protein LTR97_011283 [Elasticomyces elasticus]
MAQTPAPPSLMTLAPELRNTICELYLLGEIQAVYVKSNGGVVFQPELLAVSQQLRAETLPVFQNLAPKVARKIIVKARAFDFTAAMVFLDRLDAEQRAAVAKNKSLLIYIGVDKNPVIDMPVIKDMMKAADGLRAWFGFCATSVGGGLLASQFAERRKTYKFLHNVCFEDLVDLGDTLGFSSATISGDMEGVGRLLAMAWREGT